MAGETLRRLTFGLLLVLLFAAPGFSAQISPALIYDIGGKFDKAFNEVAFHGAARFRAATGIAFREFEIQNEAQREQALRRFASDGNTPIIVAGLAWAETLQRVADDFPDTKFALIDGEVTAANVRAIRFKEHEGSYLVGILAAMASSSKIVGFIGGMDIPLIRKFGCGFAGGALAAGASRVLEDMAGEDYRAWLDPPLGARIARMQMEAGADVIFAAAGATGTGVLQAAAEAGKLAIGVDANQNGLQPGHVLTSMLKRVDLAVENTLFDALNDEFIPGLLHLGLAEDGVGYAVDEHNRDLLRPDMIAAVEEAKADIIAGRIVVPDYLMEGMCPY